jgi:transposase
MTILPPLETLIPDDHRLRKMNRVLDLSFVHDEVRDRYCEDNGRPSIDPEVVLRLFLLQAIEGIRSVRELMREVQVNLAYRWFIGYRVDEPLPDHSTLSRALDRFGDEVFDKLFSRSVSQCQVSGLIEGRVLHVDATTIRADLDANKVCHPGSPDADARFGRFGDGSKRPGYKQQTVVDDGSRVVLGISVTAANGADERALVKMVDEASERMEAKPEAVCADGAYSSGRNQAEMERRGIQLVSPPQPEPYGSGGFAVGRFDYDESRDQFVCPAGVTLKYAGDVSGEPGKRRYRAAREECAGCRLKVHCTKAPQRQVVVGKYHGALQRLRVQSKTESFRRLYRARAPVIEGIFAEGKQWHGLGRAWRRGLAKMRIQCLLIAAVLNFKRLIAVFWTIFTPFRGEFSIRIRLSIIGALITALFARSSNQRIIPALIP